RERGHADPARPVGVQHAIVRYRGHRIHQATFGNRPCGLSRRTAKRATWPAMIGKPRLMWPPIDWATPSTTPPARVPRRLPQTAKSSHHDRLKTIDQERRTDERIKALDDADEDRRDGDDRERKRHRQSEDMSCLDSHQLSHILVVGGGAERLPDPGLVEQQL